MTEQQAGRDAATEDERLAVYEGEREELAAAIGKAVNGQYIGKPPPLLTGWQERAVSAVIAAGWLPPAAVHERVATVLADQTALKGMTVEEGALVLELGPPRELVIAWVDAARKMLGGAVNYSETRIDFPTEAVSMEVSAAGEFERYVFTVQRAGKVTPHEARRAAEAEAERLHTRLAELECRREMGDG